MSPWLYALLLGNSRRQVMQTFMANATFTAPTTTSSIDTASGYGASGSPGTDGYTDPPTTGPSGWNCTYQTYYQRRDGTGNDTVTEVGPGVYDGSPKPDSYCDPFVADPESTVYTGYTKCYLYGTVAGQTTPGEYHPPSPATTGASTTGFGKTFPGGTGGAASTTTFSNVAVTPGASYSIVVPSGGSLTITYTK